MKTIKELKDNLCETALMFENEAHCEIQNILYEILLHLEKLESGKEDE